MANARTPENDSVQARLEMWRSTVLCMCDMLVQSPDGLLDYASLTVNWVHGGSRPAEERGWSEHHLLMGTMTDGQEEGGDSILLYRVRLPDSDLESGVGASAELPSGAYQPFQLLAALPHEGNVDRVRSMPQNGAIIGSKSCSQPAIHVYNINQYMGSSSSDGATLHAEPASTGPMLTSCSPSPVQEGLGLCWSPIHEGVLLSTCGRGQVCMYRVDAGNPVAAASTSGRNASAAPLAHSAVFRGHSQQLVNDVAFAGSWAPDVFGSVGEDGTAALWDLRLAGGTSTSGSGATAATPPAAATAPVQQWQAHDVRSSPRPANSIAFSNLRPYVAATCGSDNTVRLWDLRGGSGGSTGSTVNSAQSPAWSHTALAVYHSHRCTVTQLAWCPQQAGLLASCDVRGLVYVWDVDAGGTDGGTGGAASSAAAGTHPQQRNSSVQVWPNRPELRMIHAGHAAEVNDLEWCPDGERGGRVLATVSSLATAQEPGQAGEEEDEPLQWPNVQLWRPAQHFMVSS